jgi:hypothetical protein
MLEKSSINQDETRIFNLTGHRANEESSLILIRTKPNFKTKKDAHI